MIEIDKDFQLLTKAKDLANHTIKITDNPRRFPKKYRFTFVNRMQNISLDIYELINTANELNTNDEEALKDGIDFLGFHTYLTESGKVVRKLRRGSKNRMKKKIRKYASMLEKGEITPDEVEKSYKSWKAHASHGDCYYLIKKMDQYYNEKIVKEKSNGAKIK